MRLREIQQAKYLWAERNFPADNETSLVNSVLGVSEEAGELSHALLKRRQGIRGDRATHDVEMRDAVGDIVMYLMGVCSYNHWDLEQIVNETWKEISKRDWQANPESGFVDPYKYTGEPEVIPDPYPSPITTVTIKRADGRVVRTITLDTPDPPKTGEQ